MVIYKITSPSGKIYIGQTVNFNKRESYYRRGHADDQPKIYNSILKYGWDNHVMEIIEECSSIEEMNIREEYWITFYNSCKKGLNCTSGGLNHRPSPETLEKLRIASTGKKHTEEAKEKIRQSKIGKKRNSTYKLTEEQKQNISRKNKGKKRTQEFCEKMSKVHKGRIRSEEEKRKQSEKTKGVPKSEEHKRKIKEAHLKRVELIRLQKEATDESRGI